MPTLWKLFENDGCGDGFWRDGAEPERGTGGYMSGDGPGGDGDEEEDGTCDDNYHTLTFAGAEFTFWAMVSRNK